VREHLDDRRSVSLVLKQWQALNASQRLGFLGQRCAKKSTFQDTSRRCLEVLGKQFPPGRLLLPGGSRRLHKEYFGCCVLARHGPICLIATRRIRPAIDASSSGCDREFLRGYSKPWLPICGQEVLSRFGGGFKMLRRVRTYEECGPVHSSLTRSLCRLPRR